MMSVSTIWTVKAYDGDTDEITVDGYDITIEDNTDSETVVSTFVDGVNYQITFDKTDEEFEMVTQVHYYYAYLQSGDNVYIGPRIKSQSAAATVLRAGHNVFAISSGYAYNACKSASPISRVSSRQKHSGGGKNYYHYHPMITTKKQSHAHCWFI